MATADVGWRDFFTDPLLQRLIEMSLANNRDLRVAALNVEAARAQYRIQRSNLMPSVGLAGKETAQRTPGSLTPSGEATTSHNYQVGAALSTWELDLFGRIRSLSDKALESYLALDETRTATQLSLVAEVANAYLTLRADQELLALTRDTLKSQQDSFADAAELRHRPVDRAGPEPGRGRPAHRRTQLVAVHAPGRAGPQCAGAAGGPAAA